MVLYNTSSKNLIPKVSILKEAVTCPCVLLVSALRRRHLLKQTGIYHDLLNLEMENFENPKIGDQFLVDSF